MPRLPRAPSTPSIGKQHDPASQRSRAQQWLDENREALEWSNDYVAKYGLPLARYRMF
ncbi:type II toxin-antitoxin system CcdA family antitoxin [Sphingoaurantiacus capsulatus]|uniref:Type II toxin-antitoxin system CcdA family antitoxin n=1 Tax=Sphingoaurantiacus capsulatus TaxID=1771310 RepID=A0ABV7XH78_9SPHN